MPRVNSHGFLISRTGPLVKPPHQEQHEQRENPKSHGQGQPKAVPHGSLGFGRAERRMMVRRWRRRLLLRLFGALQASLIKLMR